MSTTSGSTKKMKRQTSNVDDTPAEVEAPPVPKRQRVSRACDQCRAAREKCDGIQPLCFPCASQNRQCSWEEPKKKRGVQTGYIRTLELSLGWIFDKIPGSEEALHGLLTHEGGQGRALLLGKDTAAGNRLHRRWRKSIVQQEIDRVLSGGETAPTKTEKPSPADESESSGEEPEQPLKQEGSVTQARPAPALNVPIERTAMSATPPEIPYREMPQESSPRTVKLPPNCWRLLDIYFSYTHCWFPILEKGLVHKACWSYPGEGLDLVADSVPRSGSHAELWAALAIASFHDEASQPRSMLGESEGKLLPEEIYNAARRLIPNETVAFEARHVNALLLLALVDIGRRKYIEAWVSIGLAIRIALARNLQSQPVRNGNRRPYHTYMACFILDTLVATQINQPPHLRASNVSPIAPCGDDDQDEWDIWSPCQGFGRPSGTSPRSPAHSMSSFAALFGILRVHCAMVFEGDAEHREAYPTQIQKALGGDPARQPFVDYVTNGSVPPYQIPSIHLLRLTFLCCGSQTQMYSDSLPSTALQYFEEHLLNFGSSVPPLFPLFLDILRKQYSTDLLKGDIRDRWRQIQSSVDSVWRSQCSQSGSPVIHKPPDGVTSSYINQHSTNVLYPAASSVTTVTQQLPTPSSHYADTPADQTASMISGDVYHDSAMSAMMNFPMASRTRQPVGLMDHTNPNSQTPSQYDLTDMSTQHFPLHGRPSFSSAQFDYDSILDDIASLDRADRMGDPQFMANLGFAPGSDLTELLAHDFTSMT